MKKKIFTVILTIVLASVIIFSQGVFAAELTNAEYTNGKIAVSGTGTTQVQVVLFGLDNNPLCMVTAPIENGKFSVTLPEIADLKDGSYTIKVADYDGKNVDSKVVTVSQKKDAADNFVKTGDISNLYFIFLALAVASGSIILISLPGKNKKI